MPSSTYKRKLTREYAARLGRHPVDSGSQQATENPPIPDSPRFRSGRFANIGKVAANTQEKRVMLFHFSSRILQRKIRLDSYSSFSSYASNLKAWTHSLRRKPGMHQSIHRGSIARAASALPMSAVSHPN